jgi:hypothetical protein
MPARRVSFIGVTGTADNLNSRLAGCGRGDPLLPFPSGVHRITLSEQKSDAIYTAAGRACEVASGGGGGELAGGSSLGR